MKIIVLIAILTLAFTNVFPNEEKIPIIFPSNHNDMNLLGKKPGKCPKLREKCPPVRIHGPQRCHGDFQCYGTDKCCSDVCLDYLVCKPAEDLKTSKAFISSLGSN